MPATETLDRIRADFATLFASKERGLVTTEINTPFSTLGRSFVSVFVAEKDGAFIVSDFGWLADGEYFDAWDDEAPALTVADLEFIRPLFGIETRVSEGGRRHYYKKAESLGRLSSVVFDVAQFIQLAVNVAYLVEEAAAD